MNNRNNIKYFLFPLVIFLALSGCKSKKEEPSNLLKSSAQEIANELIKKKDGSIPPRDLGLPRPSDEFIPIEPLKPDKEKASMDETPFSILDSIPKNNARSVSPNTTLKVLFSKLIDESTIDRSTLNLRGSDGLLVLGRVNFREENVPIEGKKKTVSVLEFHPDYPLHFDSHYTFSANTAIRDLNGTPLQSDFNITFYTVTKGDDIRPTVAGVTFNPPPIEGRVDVSASVVAIFSEELDPDTVNDSSLSIHQIINGRNGPPLPAKITLKGNRVTVQPMGPMPAESNMIFIINKTVSDVNGNRLLVANSNIFRTD